MRPSTNSAVELVERMGDRLSEAKRLDLRRLQRRIVELEEELELERAFNRPAVGDGSLEGLVADVAELGSAWALWSGAT